MSDAIARQLKREPRSALRPFFAPRVAALAHEKQLVRRRRWLALYWIVAILASIFILAKAPGSSHTVRDAAPAVISVCVVVAAFYRRAIRRMAQRLFE
jgi:hypothetical protein